MNRLARSYSMMYNTFETNVKRGSIPCLPTELNLTLTLHGGQSFRWTNCDAGYRGVFDGCVWTLSQNKTHLLYTVQGRLKDSINYDDILSKYLRLSVPLQEHYKKWAAVDMYFQKCLNENNAVRILKQDVVETVFSFICSSNNNITRISSMVEKLCLLFGQKICSVESKDYYDFPTIQSLMENNIESVLKREKFGYRARYIVNAAQRLSMLGGKNWLLSLQRENNVPYHIAREQLMILPGIGPKVADCICLMSLGHLDAIPIDTHIFQIAQANYLPHLKRQKTITPKIHTEVNDYLRELWGPLAGWAQAIVFSAKINTKSELVGKRKFVKDSNENSVSGKASKRT
ncbi:N-glycosylase/DNA lyase [Odontomachus brunneus]|uniref:N-glycosylase/DNA lyase n=1 Tax=Odontomachus brunneus TaxID=486640 RepID=UPI0013F228FF|nr:N-glycosylase/DNA lyase [Odontomachus brunneus]XP_032664495.1 N-glycosylase/DNA lyase [Odontomachus brunneus]